MNTDKNKDQNKDLINKGNKVPNIHPTAQKKEGDDKFRSDEDDQAGRSIGNEPRTGGRQGGKSVEDGGQDIGSSAGSR
ncbi:hypothetical protein H9Q13_01950 [Pontibacter sp. JH31]|uniref:Uncharacterized protein n=1 Tax=Pontibacter aquaedesilientis TaxID=2766980 RepID=A0ABR7XC92_9BACT|nr:hypothetical protein [Pontibacter aquaedesilientis]MBD1395914.1 hypothetical protein [Pontibacter aquaedesilientis]